jgi:hypothetical protein
MKDIKRKLLKVKIVALFLILSIFLMSGCGTVFSSKEKEGVIHYQLEYLVSSDSIPVVSLLPKKMDIFFKNNNVHQKIQGFGGLFYMGGVKNTKDSTMAAMLKIMGKKYLHKETHTQHVKFGYDSYPKMIFEKTNEKKIIGGLPCYKVRVKFPNHEMKDFDLYYTKKIKLKNPNWNNPFKEIDGVLMDYEISIFGIPTHVSAENVEFIRIDDSEFELPTDFKVVTQKEMEETIDELI